MANNEFYFQWHITEKCNLRCQHCYHSDYSSNNELSLDNLITIADKIDKTLQKWGKSGSLSITGGEPLLRKDNLFKLAERLDILPSLAYFDILTNGSLIDKPTANKLKTFKKLRRVQLSLEGACKEVNDNIRGEGSFEKTISAIRLLKDNHFKIAVMMTLSRINKNEVEPLVELVKKEGVDAFSIERFIPEGNGTDMQEAALSSTETKDTFELIHKLALNSNGTRILLYRPLFALCDLDDQTVGAMCSVGINALTIMHDGTIYPCRRLPIPIGNALTDSFHKIWYTSDILWNIRNHNNFKGKCHNCEFIPLCRGCRGMAYATTGDYLEEDPQCWK